MEVAPPATGGCPVRNFFAWIENSGWRKVLAMPMVTIRMLGWSGAKVACQKSACDTMSLKCQGTWRTGGRHVFCQGHPKKLCRPAEAASALRACLLSRRMPGETHTLIRRLDAAPRKPHSQKTMAPLSFLCPCIWRLPSPSAAHLSCPFAVPMARSRRNGKRCPRHIR